MNNINPGSYAFWLVLLKLCSCSTCWGWGGGWKREGLESCLWRKFGKTTPMEECSSTLEQHVVSHRHREVTRCIQFYRTAIHRRRPLCSLDLSLVWPPQSDLGNIYCHDCSWMEQMRILGQSCRLARMIWFQTSLFELPSPFCVCKWLGGTMLK